MFRHVLLTVLLSPVFCVTAGGGLGALARFYLSGWMQRTTGTIFPYGTLVVNLLGCFLIGIMAGLMQSPYSPREEYRWFLVVGVLGGFTTFSTFGFETFMLINKKEVFFAFGNLLLSNVLGVCLVFIGYRVAQRWFGV